MNDQLQQVQDAAKEIAHRESVSVPGLRITLEPALSFTNRAIRYGLRIERERTTSTGRPGKPTPIVMLVNNPDESPADMLRTLADVLEQDGAA